MRLVRITRALGQQWLFSDIPTLAAEEAEVRAFPPLLRKDGAPKAEGNSKDGPPAVGSKKRARARSFESPCSLTTVHCFLFTVS